MTRQHLIDTLDIVRHKKVCVYTMRDFCDCKFITDTNPFNLSGEASGCCELRTVIKILKKMSDEDFKKYTL